MTWRSGAPAAALLVVATGTAGWAAFAPLSAESRAVTYVIPPGTAARLKSGELQGVLPWSISTSRSASATCSSSRTTIPPSTSSARSSSGPARPTAFPFDDRDAASAPAGLHAAGTLTLLVDREHHARLARLRWRLDRLVARS